MLTNKYGLPLAIVEAVKRDPYVGGGDISTTALIDAPQRRTLLYRHKDSIDEDVSQRVWSLLGQAVHHILERSGVDGVRVEERLYASVEGWQISGQFDRVDGNTLQDYKVTTVSKFQGDRTAWTQQLNILRWLCYKNDIDIDKLEIVAILRDWSQSRKDADGSYPLANIVVANIDVWPIAKTEAFIVERVKLHQKARAGERIPCTNDDRWYSGDTWAVRNPNHKRALRVFQNRHEAEAFKTDSTIVEHRPGEYRRCENYCEVSRFCPQHNGALHG